MTKGFTLIELLIVIGILAILATTVVLVLNPAQILAESRDTQRISDLGSVNSAIGLYLATAGSIDMAAVGECIGETSPNYWATRAGVTSPYTYAFVSVDQHANIERDVDGTGWVPIDFSLISGGSPLATLPNDPTDTGTDLTAADGHFYTYTCSGNTFEINGNMESDKFGNNGGSDVESNDGGPAATNAIYEIGTAPGLNL